MSPAIQTDQLTKDFRVGFWRTRPYRAVGRDLTLEVQPGEVFGFLGPNGAGKTTTLKLLMQLLYPTSGRAFILGRPAGDLDVRRRIGYLPENPYFYDYLTAEELLTYFAGLFGLSGQERRAARRDAARRGRARRRAPAAAAQVLEGDGPARRDRAGPRQSSRGRSSSTSRCLVSTRSAGATSAPSSCACAIRARPSSSARTSCRTPRRSAAAWPILAGGRLAAAGRLSDLVAYDLRGWELVVSGLRRRAAAPVRARA